MNTYKLLSDNSWGVQTDTKPAVGDVLTVTKKSGEVKRETVTAVWQRGDKFICGIGKTGGGRCAGCDRYSSKLTNRFDSSGIEGMVCASCDRQADYELSFG